MIDRAEAEFLFRQVKRPEGPYQTLIDALKDKAYDPLSGNAEMRLFLSDQLEEEEETHGEESHEEPSAVETVSRPQSGTSAAAAD